MRRVLATHSIAMIAIAISARHSDALGEIPKRTSEALHAEASLVVAGVVCRTYEHDETHKHIVHTYGVAEIIVKTVIKGERVENGDRLFVRYWRDTKVDPKMIAPGHYGHWNVPSKGDTVVVYSKGGRKDGYDVLSPNGFYEVLKPLSDKEAADKK